MIGLGAAPALPLHSAGKYVAGAYLVFLAIVLIYVAIMAVRLARTERDIAELARDVRARSAAEPEPDAEPVLAGRFTRSAGDEPRWPTEA